MAPPSSVCQQVVEIALKVSPILGAHMFQPLLPAVFKGIVDGEVSFAMRPYTLRVYSWFFFLFAVFVLWLGQCLTLYVHRVFARV